MIVRESQKSRRVEILKERLGNLYYPLKYSKRHFKSLKWENHRFTKDVEEFFQNIQRYSYLASEELFKLLPPLLTMIDEMIDEGAKNFDVKYRQKLSEMGDTIIEQVKKDCLEYEGELDRLVGK